MEVKKGVGDVMNQLAMISDLLGNVNLTTESVSVDIVLGSEDFDELHEKVVQRRGFLLLPKKTFNMVVSGIKFTFKRN